MAPEDAPQPEPISIPDIPQNKYTIFQHQAERLQIILGLTDSNYYLSGSVYLEIETDSGQKLVSGPHEIALCVPDKYSFDDTLGVSSVAFSPEDNLLAAGYNDGSVILWDASSSELISRPSTIHSSPVKRLAFTPSGQLLASGSQSGEIYLSTVNDLDTVVGPLLDDTGVLHSLAISPIHFEQKDTAGMMWGDWVSSVVFNNSGTQVASVR